MDHPNTPAEESVHDIIDSIDSVSHMVGAFSCRRIGQDEYDNLDTISKQKIDEFTDEQAIATQAFLQRQELNITDMEAYGQILPGQIKVLGGLTAPSGPPGVPVALVNPATNTTPIKFRVQISDRSNKVGLPEVGRMVKRTLVRFVRIFF